MTTSARRNRVRWTVGRMLTAGFAVALLALAVVGAAAFNRLGALMQAQHPLSQSHRVLGGIGKLGDLVNQVDRAQRGYLAEHSDASLQLYRDASAAFTRTVDELRGLTVADPEQQRLLAQVRTLFAAATRVDAAAGDDREDRFNRLTDMVNALHDHENALLDQRLRTLDASARRTRLLIVAVCLGTALFVAGAGRWITRRITSAAHEVTAGAGRVIAGDVSRPAVVTGPTELAQMAQAVNASMTAMATARDEAVAATAAKSAFLAAMSHEIRTPMNAVIGGTNLLDDGTLTAEQHELVEIVRGSAESLLVIINDILDFSKIEAGELVLDEEPVILRGLVDDAVNLVALTADAKGLRLGVEAAPDCPVTVIGDETRLRQILVNLLGNAVKFTDRGGVSVRVAAGPAPEPGRVELRIAVRDTGIGIDAAQLDRLFVAFGQVDSSATRTGTGTGLGLVISRRLAEAMGGTITVESTPGAGSTFTLVAYVGLADRSAGPPPRTAPRPVRAARDQPPLHVLLAEDNPINQRVAELMLTRRGHRVDIVDNGADAVRAVHEVAYALVLMDVRMPVLDGLAATELIRADPPAHGAPRIVALTANATVDDQAAGRRAGMDDFLAKPIQESELDVVLAAAAGHADAGRRLTAPAGPIGHASGPDVTAAAAPPATDDDDIRASVTGIAGADFANQVRLADILLAFARRLPTVLAELDEAVVDGDHPRVDRLAHGLKGSAATLGAHRLAGACAHLEAYAQQRDRSGAAGALREVHDRADAAGRAVTAVSQELVAAAG